MNVIEMKNITKIFPGIVANDNITLALKKGEIHALLGENGAGKSTLMSVLFGLYQPEGGEILKDGEIVEINNPNDANILKIGMVHQHFKLVENFSVVENIMLGAESLKNGFLDKATARKKVAELSEKYNLSVEPDVLIEDISVGMQQRVEILKMLYRDNNVLIFDEPTAVLTPQEIEELMDIMRGFTKEGKSILFITHKIEEIMAVADRCTVLRKGKSVGTVEISATSKSELSRMMTGRDVNFTVLKKEIQATDEILSVEHLSIDCQRTKKKLLNDINFSVKAGEIVCLAGIEGNGQQECVDAIAGLIKPKQGKITLRGTDVTHKNIRYRNENGLAHIPADRHKYGMILDYSVAENMVLQTYFKPPFNKMGFLNHNEIKKYSDRLIEEYDVRSGQGSTSVARGLSGGNQQKVIIAREITKEHDLLISVQPTRGLDLGAIEYIHDRIVAERDSGKGVLLVSLELDEVFNLSDRILVMYEGEIVAELNPKETTREEIGLYMAGSKRRGNE